MIAGDDNRRDGIEPGASSWTTVTLAPGRYELVCNLPGHYAAAMYTRLTVRWLRATSPRRCDLESILEPPSSGRG